jgi:hypothetical protein
VWSEAEGWASATNKNNRSLKKCVGEQRNSYQSSKIEMISVLLFGKAPNVAAVPLLLVRIDPLKSAPFSWAKPSQSAPATPLFDSIQSKTVCGGRICLFPSRITSTVLQFSSFIPLPLFFKMPLSDLGHLAKMPEIL